MDEREEGGALAEGIFVWLPKESVRTLKTELRRVLEG